MSETAIVSSVPGDLHDEVRICTTPEGGSLLEQLRAAYRGLGREEQRQVKSVLLTFSRSNGDSL
jgi:hypothetical protein